MIFDNRKRTAGLIRRLSRIYIGLLNNRRWRLSFKFLQLKKDSRLATSAILLNLKHIGVFAGCIRLFSCLSQGTRATKG